MLHDLNLLGIDIGSVSVALAEINPREELICSKYAFHRGDPKGCLEELLGDMELSGIGAVSATSSTPSFVKARCRFDDRVCMITACCRIHGRVGSILFVGAEKSGLIRFDSEGHYRSYRGNPSCAAGTGSFLDQQARRLNLDGSESLSAMASRNHGLRPQIATRCAVFAKTDLAHSQQEGYSLAAICDGLCHGLARNIVDRFFAGPEPLDLILFIGGVARNRAVSCQIETLLGRPLLVDGSGVHGALGAALCLHPEVPPEDRRPLGSVNRLFDEAEVCREYFYPALKLKQSDYPDFESLEPTLFTCGGNPDNPVEVDRYEDVEECGKLGVYLGIDIGSTSTKAVLLNSDLAVVAGFYTRTGGRPLEAVQGIFAAVEELARSHGVELLILGAGTTGSGRKFIGKIIGADLILDEITAHARAAVQLEPDVDTIIEIGGQDSKFTTLRKGTVTSASMNTVCAAGTGSFIEEQAQKLGCSLGDFSMRAENRRAPLSSDRCTVFMERDLNQHLTEGYAVDEVLASVLHAVRENYLRKVAVESQIGDRIVFQGATAKNRSLVAAFEQKLGKPIRVSKFCHLAGALGAALILAEKGVATTSFRGTRLHQTRVPIRSEVCRLCNNRCKLVVADVAGTEVAYGFLCGRDYDTRKYVDNNRSGFDLLGSRRRVFALPRKPIRDDDLTIAIPAALHLQEDLPFWRRFFSELGIRTETSEGFREAVQYGKNLACAEFCAPIMALHGHVNYLLEDKKRGGSRRFVFLPLYLERKSKRRATRRQYCYYTQFAPALVSHPEGTAGSDSERILTPLVHYLYHDFHTKAQLHRMLAGVSSRRIGFLEVSAAFEKALEFKTSCSKKLAAIYRERTARAEDIHVVLLGRPYSVLLDSMNKKIPHLLASLGIQVFFQDMLNIREEDVSCAQPLLDEFHWHYAKEILAAAEKTAQTPGAYPVLITSFRCAPDSFAIDYFKEIMEAHQKPYLVLQLDEHDSSVGYETRLEAALRSFRNHFRGVGRRTSVRYPPALNPRPNPDLTGKTLFIPNWDDLTLRFVTANLRCEGIDARLLPEKVSVIRKSLRSNAGQCIPLNIIAQEFIDHVREQGLDPARCVLWIARSSIACNIGMFPDSLRRLIQSQGEGMERAEVYAGELSFLDLSVKLPVNTYFAHMFGGFLRKMACHVRPYECRPGATDQVLERGARIFEDAFLGNRSKEEAVREVVTLFRAIEVCMEPRPKVAIFGDFYVRDNDVMNQNLIRFIENHGGEVVTTPYSAYVKMVASPYVRKWLVEGHLLGALSSTALMAIITRLERTYLRYFSEVLGAPEPQYAELPQKILSRYNIRIEHTGESMDNLLKVFYIKRQYPDLALFVHASPAFCCPSLITEAMARSIERHTGVPVVSVTYDGTGGTKNEAIIPYLRFRHGLGEGEAREHRAGS